MQQNQHPTSWTLNSALKPSSSSASQLLEKGNFLLPPQTTETLAKVPITTTISCKGHGGNKDGGLQQEGTANSL